MSSFLYGFLLLLLCYTHDTYSFLRFPGKRPFPESSSCRLIPKDISFEANQIEITKVLGKIEVLVDKSSLEEIHYELEKLGDETAKKAYLKWLQSSYSPERKAVTSVRIFEARIPGGNRCYVKEYLPIGYLFGRRELAASRKLISRWNELSDSTESSTSPINSPFPPVPILLGSLRTDERISDPSFRRRWMKLFPKRLLQEKEISGLSFDGTSLPSELSERSRTFRRSSKVWTTLTKPVDRINDGDLYGRFFGRVSRRWITFIDRDILIMPFPPTRCGSPPLTSCR